MKINGDDVKFKIIPQILPSIIFKLTAVICLENDQKVGKIRNLTLSTLMSGSSPGIWTCLR